MWLGHIHSRRQSKMHRYAIGVPDVPIATELDNCPVCAQAKLRKAAASKESTQHATQCGQGIFIDFGFLVQSSSTDSSRVDRLKGMYGETCYCLIVDHHSGTLYGEAFQSKGPPLDFLNRWLSRHGLPHDVPDKYVRFDLGGDLGRCRAVVELFERAGYSVEPTAPDSSHSNGPGERPHQTLGDAMRAMLGGAGLSPKFWIFAFHHFVRLYNVTVHGDSKATPYKLCTGKKPNLSLLRTFSCRVYALPPRPNGRRPDRITSDARTGIFLGYTKTMKNVLYFDVETETVKSCQNVIFDESMNDVTDKPPNARLLDRLRPGRKRDIVDMRDAVPDLEVSDQPFLALKTITVSLDSAADRPLGLGFSACRRLHPAFVSEIDRPPSGRSLRAFRREFLGSYVVSIERRSPGD
jgi:hypothetical protein